MANEINVNKSRYFSIIYIIDLHEEARTPFL